MFFDENQSTDRFAWVEYIEDEALYERLRSLSFNDLELVTMIAMEGYTQAEVARIRDVSRSAITQQMQKIKKFLKTT